MRVDLSGSCDPLGSDPLRIAGVRPCLLLRPRILWGQALPFAAPEPLSVAAISLLTRDTDSPLYRASADIDTPPSTCAMRSARARWPPQSARHRDPSSPSSLLLNAVYGGGAEPAIGKLMKAVR
jgi:hypothetical protein